MGERVIGERLLKGESQQPTKRCKPLLSEAGLEKTLASELSLTQ
jgi:hypothetical protein